MTIPQQLAIAQSDIHQTLNDKSLSRKEKDRMLKRAVDVLEKVIRELASLPIGG